MGNSSVTFTRTKKLLGNVRLAFGVGEDDLHNFAQAAKARRTNLHNLCEINSLESDTTRRAHSCSPETISPCKIQGFDIRPTPCGIDRRFSEYRMVSRMQRYRRTLCSTSGTSRDRLPIATLACTGSPMAVVVQHLRRRNSGPKYRTTSRHEQDLGKTDEPFGIVRVAAALANLLNSYE